MCRLQWQTVFTTNSPSCLTRVRTEQSSNITTDMTTIHSVHMHWFNDKCSGKKPLRISTYTYFLRFFSGLSAIANYRFVSIRKTAIFILSYWQREKSTALAFRSAPVVFYYNTNSILNTYNIKIHTFTFNKSMKMSIKMSFFRHIATNYAHKQFV